MNSHTQGSLWMPIWAGLCASLVGIGLARFAYTPLIPSLIEAQWFSASAVVYLGAANLAGYLLGALIGRPLAARHSSANVLRAMMLLVSLAFLACAWPLSVAWFFSWRLLSGIAGGVIMVLAASSILPHVAAGRRGLASGAIFLGLGLGIAGSGTLVPILLTQGLATTWIGMAVVALLLTLSSWRGWPDDLAHTPQPATPHAPAQSAGGVRLLFAQYALMASSLVAPMMFLVDYISRGLGEGSHSGALIWTLYGVGAIVGPVVYGYLADHLGARAAIRLVLLLQAMAITVLVESRDLHVLGAAVLVIGSFPPGIVPLALARVHQLVTGHAQQNATWSRATISFATFQALAGYAYSALFSASQENYRLLFTVAIGAVLVALLLELPSLLGKSWSNTPAGREVT
ncbi:putative MFS family arabinose efflux permease [Ectopseudomonas oleovorans]|uniref:Putative MFS family arabinose efflux permease n=1 Tax=Ectopseudomonas oleovorans TaxID=301 RepID=A0A397NB06_ECTOL|nr:YbfB/YjiJ family MFS transporter [Pseudomonas oleovorans]RIA31705.1 putative MFS family arabinose efflux permease [Pseudomonas oleovorans]